MLSCLAPVAVLCSADPVLTDSSYRGSLGKENLLVYVTRYLTCRYVDSVIMTVRVWAHNSQTVQFVVVGVHVTSHA